MSDNKDNIMNFSIDFNDYDGGNFKEFIASAVSFEIQKKAVQEIAESNIRVFNTNEDILSLKSTYEEAIKELKSEKVAIANEVKKQIKDVFDEFLRGIYIETSEWGEEKRRITIEEYLKESISKGLNNMNSDLKKFITSEVSRRKPDEREIRKIIEENAIATQNLAIKAVVSNILGEQSEKIMKNLANKMIENKE